MKECFGISGANTEEKVDVSGEKSAQISIVAKKTVTQRWFQIMIMESKQATHYNYCYYYYYFSYYVHAMLLIWSKNWNYI